jgi:hypothetical protein
VEAQAAELIGDGLGRAILDRGRIGRQDGGADPLSENLVRSAGTE